MKAYVVLLTIGLVTGVPALEPDPCADHPVNSHLPIEGDCADFIICGNKVFIQTATCQPNTYFDPVYLYCTSVRPEGCPTGSTPQPVTSSSVRPGSSTQNTTTPKPVTSSTVSSAPPTLRPVTPNPSTSRPVTPSASTSKPVTTVPSKTSSVTPNPPTTKPVTAVPSTRPVTPNPPTTKPVTTVPSTSRPVTPNPSTTKPVTPTPSTQRPVTPRPSIPTTTRGSDAGPSPSAGNCTCNAAYLGQLVSYVDDCTKFCVCQYYDEQGLNQVLSCPSGLYFNPRIQACDWPLTAGCPYTTVL